MDKNEPNDQSEKKDKEGNFLLCTKCGFPHRTGDNTCMYCGFPLNKIYKPTLKDKWIHYLNQRKWNKEKAKRKNNTILSVPNKKNSFKKRIFMYLIGIALTITGVIFFLSSTVSKSFQSWLIAILFLLYGLYTIVFTYKS